MNRTLTTSALVVFSLSLAMTFSGCLKTRSQIRGETGDQDQAEESIKASPSKTPRYEMEELKNELTRISGKLEEVEHKQRGQNAQEVKDYATRLDARIADLEKNQTLLMTEIKALKDKADVEQKEAAIPASDLFSEANKLLKQKNFEDAAEKFRTLLNKGIKGKELAEVHFGLGEAEYGMKNFKKAIVQYSKVQEAFSKSAKVPASLLKIGLSFQNLNMVKEARGFFQELGERFPKSPEAKKAHAKVKE